MHNHRAHGEPSDAAKQRFPFAQGPRCRRLRPPNETLFIKCDNPIDTLIVNAARVLTILISVGFVGLILCAIIAFPVIILYLACVLIVVLVMYKLNFIDIK